MASTSAPRSPSTASRAPAAPAVTGVTANARGSDHRSRRIGPAKVTAPLGMATTTVKPSPGPIWAWLNCATPSVKTTACSQGPVEPGGPAKQAARVTATGALTRTVAWSMGTSHRFPTAFQYSSS